MSSASQANKTADSNRSRSTLDRLLRERNEHPERLSEIDAMIHAQFEARHAVMVLDMAGFSRLTMRYGITHFLAMIQRMHDLVLPVVNASAYGGRVVKTEADNVFAIFPTVAPCVEAVGVIHARLASANLVLPADWDVHVSIGIGYGDLLVVEETDLFGRELNLASKLGEDIALADEVLLTEAAYAELSKDAYPADRREAALSGLKLPYYRLRLGHDQTR